MEYVVFVRADGREWESAAKFGQLDQREAVQLADEFAADGRRAVVMSVGSIDAVPMFTLVHTGKG